MSESRIEKKKPVLKLTNVNKNFGGVSAAKDFSLEIASGKIFGLIGPNGAGKTTLINLITGIYPVSSGTIEFDGINITKKPTYKRAKAGIGRTFQHPHLLGRCDIATNIIVGSDFADRKGSTTEDKENEVMELLECAGLGNVDLSASIGKLSYGQQKLIEVIRVLLSHPKVLLLDEPAAGLNNKELKYVASLIRYASEQNIAVLLIEHSMELVMSICERITVLNFGAQIATGNPTEIQSNQKVIEAYLGGGFNAED